jgi:hypothetical protein
VPALEAEDVLAVGELGEHRLGGVGVVGVDVLAEWPRQQLLFGEAEDPCERRVDQLQVAVETRIQKASSERPKRRPSSLSDALLDGGICLVCSLPRPS